jgi:hypothetical protein
MSSETSCHRVAADVDPRWTQSHTGHISGVLSHLSLLYFAAVRREKATRDDRKWPVTWVGVAGFEPAASSSRTQFMRSKRF